MLVKRIERHWRGWSHRQGSGQIVQRSATLLLAILVACVPLLQLNILVRTIWNGTIQVPFQDEWDTVILVQHDRQGQLTWNDLWAAHNGHRIFFPRLVDLILIEATHWNRQIEMLFDLGVALTSYVLLLWCVYATLRSRYAAMALAIPFSLLIFSFTQFENWLAPFQLQFFLAIFGGVLCMTALVWQPANWYVFGLAIGGALLASLSSLHGLAVWFALLPLVWSIGRRQAIVWAGAATITTIAYFSSGMTAGASAPSSVEEILGYALAYLGAPVGFPDLRRAQLLGFMSIALLLANLAALFLLRAPIKPVVAWISLGLFALGCTALTTLGRGSALGVGQALSSRYHAFAALWWVALLVIGWYSAGSLLAYLRKQVRAYSQIAGRGLISLNVAGCLLALSNLVAANRVGMDSLAIWQAGLQGAQNCVLEYETAPDTCLQLFNPIPSLVRNRAAYLETEQLGIFRSVWKPDIARLIRRDDVTPYSLDSVGGVVLTQQPGQPLIIDRNKPITITGWAIDAGNRTAAGAVLIAVDDERIFQAEYGSARPDVAATFGSDAYFKSGYMLTLPSGLLPPGEHRLAIKIVTSDRRAYYNSPDAVLIDVR